MHIEPTSRCTFACPGCSRTWFQEKFQRSFPHQDLDLDSLVAFLDCDTGREIDTISLCGNHGDTIYYDKLFDLLDRLRTPNRKFQIHTAGGHRPRPWWQQLAARLTENDVVIFSIDGLESDNHVYRINSDWDRINSAVDVISGSRARMVWKTLAFSYNQDRLDEIRQYAESRGAEWIYSQTYRYGRENLRPTKEHYHRDRDYADSMAYLGEIGPQCPRTEYISASGIYYPCCWVANIQVLAKTPFYHDQPNWSIQNHTLDELRDRVIAWAQVLRQDPKQALDACKIYCKKGQQSPWSLG